MGATVGKSTAGVYVPIISTSALYADGLLFSILPCSPLHSSPLPLQVSHPSVDPELELEGCRSDPQIHFNHFTFYFFIAFVPTSLIDFSQHLSGP